MKKHIAINSMYKKIFIAVVLTTLEYTDITHTAQTDNRIEISQEEDQFISVIASYKKRDIKFKESPEISTIQESEDSICSQLSHIILDRRLIVCAISLIFFCLAIVMIWYKVEMSNIAVSETALSLTYKNYVNNLIDLQNTLMKQCVTYMYITQNPQRELVIFCQNIKNDMSYQDLVNNN